MEEVSEQLRFVIDKIREFRQRQSLSQLDLSVKAHLSQSFLASLEKGKKQPSVLTLLRIARALNVSPKSFFPENNDKPKDEVKDLIINLVRTL